MKKSFLLSAMILLFLPLTAAERTVDKTFTVDSGSRFSLDVHKGHINVRTDMGSTVSVSARVYLTDEQKKGLSADQIDNVMEALEIKFREGSGYVDVSVDFDSGDVLSGLLGNHRPMPFVDFDIIVPDDSSLALETHKGTLDVDAPAGKVSIESHKGTGTILGVRSDFEMETHKGQFKVEVLELHDLEVETHKGDVTITIHAANDFTIRGDSHKGDIDVRGVAVEKQREDRSSYINHKQGSGANRIELGTHKGNIVLDFVK
jgi:hypothetical protein